MCWSNKRNTSKIADNDVHVFKIVSILDDRAFPFFRWVQWCYVEGKRYETQTSFKIYNSAGIGYEVHQALHSFSVNNVRLTTRDITSGYIRVCTYKTTQESHDILNGHSQRYRTTNVGIMLCIIPKGTRYAVNSVGEIVSDAIEVVKIIKNPFTFNKDRTVSEKSITKVNKILDNWEKGKV